jgi:hypothetical protein
MGFSPFVDRQAPRRVRLIRKSDRGIVFTLIYFLVFIEYTSNQFHNFEKIIHPDPENQVDSLG